MEPTSRYQVGGSLSVETVARLRCRVVAGSANNQLAEAAAARLMRERGILYAPDFVINAGGLIAVADELHRFVAPAGLALALLAVCYMAIQRIIKSKLGRAFEALRDDPIAAAYAPAALEVEGFVHCSHADAVVDNLRFFAGAARNMEGKAVGEYLGVAKYRFGEIEDNDLVGVVTGLAWTDVGGELLTWLTRTVDFWGNIASIGLVGSPRLETTPLDKAGAKQVRWETCQ